MTTDPDPVSDPGGTLDEDHVFTEVHGQLRAIAARQMSGERASHTLQATALVSEAWLALRDRLEGIREQPGRFHLAAAEAMRRILIDHARRRNAKKRGGGFDRLSLDLIATAQTASLDDVLSLDQAIVRLREVSDRSADVVHLRFYAGLEESEIAESLGISVRTVRREWSFARAWLYRQLADS